MDSIGIFTLFELRLYHKPISPHPQSFKRNVLVLILSTRIKEVLAFPPGGNRFGDRDVIWDLHSIYVYRYLSFE